MIFNLIEISANLTDLCTGWLAELSTGRLLT